MPKKASLRRGLLLDIDGIIAWLVDHFGEVGVSARLLHEVRIIDGLSDVLTELAGLGFDIVGLTNQPDIARRKITKRFLARKHAMIQAKYPQIQDILVCPHTETDLCPCRKPKSGLLRQAARKYNLDLAESWVVGDSWTDMVAGRRVHARTVFVPTPDSFKDDLGITAFDLATGVAKSPLGALKLIVEVERKATNRSTS